MPQVEKLHQQGRVSICRYDYSVIPDPSHISSQKKLIFFIFNSLQLLEMFGAGTACVVSPIERIHYLGKDILIPTMQQDNAMFRWILKTLTDIQYGKVEHPWAPVIE